MSSSKINDYSAFVRKFKTERKLERKECNPEEWPISVKVKRDSSNTKDEYAAFDKNNIGSKARQNRRQWRNFRPFIPTDIPTIGDPDLACLYHPRLPKEVAAPYYVSKEGIVYEADDKGELSVKTPPGPSNHLYRFTDKDGKHIDIRLEEIVVATFVDKFKGDGEKKMGYIMHVDGNQLNFRLHNLMVNKVDKIKDFDWTRLSQLDKTARYITINNIHDKLAFKKYLVSDSGRIFSLALKDHIRPTKSCDGFQHILLTSDNYTEVSFPVHCIVLQSFNSCRIKQDNIRHINHNTADNSLANLELINNDDLVRQKCTMVNSTMHGIGKISSSTHAKPKVARATNKKEERKWPLPPVTEETKWATVGFLPWIELAFDNYEVSAMGHVRIKNDAALVPINYSFNGTATVCLTCYDTPYQLQVSQLVAYAFVKGYSEHRSAVIHINKTRQDNRAENLQWVEKVITKSRSRVSRKVTASLLDDPENVREYPSISNAEKALSISLRKKRANEETFTQKVTWDGKEQLANIQVS
ncbi:hypothetical protein BJV82DRAFT_586508 [Fennellomyces sp. T-0311]|nr:hypothetical protein BJV82DRAFT_586508 [Fennellomyces sp. T-0311]